MLNKQVLKKGHQQEWETKISLLRSLPHFKGYSPKELQELNNAAKLVEYPHNTVSFAQLCFIRNNNNYNHKYNTILETDWLSPALYGRAV